jgi:hypothetical protein
MSLRHLVVRLVDDLEQFHRQALLNRVDCHV